MTIMSKGGWKGRLDPTREAVWSLSSSDQRTLLSRTEPRKLSASLRSRDMHDTLGEVSKRLRVPVEVRRHSPGRVAREMGAPKAKGDR